MKIRDSGMPDEELWNSFFDIDLILTALNIDNSIRHLVEIGSGYGTFTIPAAKKINGTVYAFDIDEDIINILNNNLNSNSIENVIIRKCDIILETTGLKENTADYVILFNILHGENPEILLQEAYRILKPNGKAGILHWRSDIMTPRGPDLSIRPKPEDIIKQIDLNQFRIEKQPLVLEPYHFGLVISKK